MARSCAICGKVSMGGFNPQSSGMNRVRAHRRMQPNLQPLVIEARARRRRRSSAPAAGAPAQVRQVARRRRAPARPADALADRSPDGRFVVSPRATGRRVEPDRERAVVDELDRHLGTEPAGRHGHAQPAQRIGEPQVEPLGEVRRGGAGEPGPASAARVGEERELRDHQRRPADVEQRPVRPPVVVAEDAQLGRLAGQVVGDRLRRRPARRRGGRPAPAPISPTTSPSTRDPRPGRALEQALTGGWAAG